MFIIIGTLFYHWAEVSEFFYRGGGGGFDFTLMWIILNFLLRIFLFSFGGFFMWFKLQNNNVLLQSFFCKSSLLDAALASPYPKVDRDHSS